jgi:hypothetical protein
MTKHLRLTDAALPPHWRAERQRERRESRQAAVAFVRSCAQGDASRLHNAAHWLDETVGGWPLAMAKVARLPKVSRKVQLAFLPIWVEHKHLPLAVGSRPIMAKALRRLMPGNYRGSNLTLYRGTHSGERRRRLYGFSWTTDLAIARSFAEKRGHPPMTGVVLQTTAPVNAILLIRNPEDYYDEGEVVVDPYQLGKIDVVLNHCCSNEADTKRRRRPEITRS